MNQLRVSIRKVRFIPMEATQATSTCGPCPASTLEVWVSAHTAAEPGTSASGRNIFRPYRATTKGAARAAMMCTANSCSTSAPAQWAWSVVSVQMVQLCWEVEENGSPHRFRADNGPVPILTMATRCSRRRPVGRHLPWWLQPPVLLRKPRGLGAGAGTGLADRRGQVVAHCALGQVQRPGQVGDGATGGGLAEHVGL